MKHSLTHSDMILCSLFLSVRAKVEKMDFQGKKFKLSSGVVAKVDSTTTATTSVVVVADSLRSHSTLSPAVILMLCDIFRWPSNSRTFISQTDIIFLKTKISSTFGSRGGGLSSKPDP